MFLQSLIESIYLLSDTASRKVRNLLTDKTCFIDWVEVTAYRQWTGLTQMCQIICTFKCHYNSIKRMIKFISNTRQKKKNNTDFLLRLPDISALSGCTRRIPLSKNEWNTCFLVICFNTRYVPLLRNIPPVLQWDARECNNILFTAEETRATGNTLAWRLHAGLQSPLFWPFAQNLYLLYYNVAGKTVLEGESRHQSSAKQQQVAMFVSDNLEKRALLPRSVACEQQTHFRSSLLSLRKVAEGEKWLPEMRLLFGGYSLITSVSTLNHQIFT